MVWFWGLVGAVIYGGSALIFALWADGATEARRYRAGAEFCLALLTGVGFAQGFTPTGVAMMAHGFTVNGVWVKAVIDPVPVALTIGWCSNYLWPKLLRRLGNKVDALPVERTDR